MFQKRRSRLHENFSWVVSPEFDVQIFFHNELQTMFFVIINRENYKKKLVSVISTEVLVQFYLVEKHKHVILHGRTPSYYWITGVEPILQTAFY